MQSVKLFALLLGKEPTYFLILRTGIRIEEPGNSTFSTINSGRRLGMLRFVVAISQFLKFLKARSIVLSPF